MTFEDWLKTQPTLDDFQERIARIAWQAAFTTGWDKGYNVGFEECRQLKEIHKNCGLNNTDLKIKG